MEKNFKSRYMGWKEGLAIKRSNKAPTDGNPTG
nr:hypothetical protein [Mucilaginibacter sp. X4EP1]